MQNSAHRLPQLNGGLYVTDGGIETWLVYQRGIELRHFAAFELLNRQRGLETLTHYYRQYAAIAAAYGLGLVLESATWRANPDWAQMLGYDRPALAEINAQAIAMLHRLRIEYGSRTGPIVISGCVGPRGDGYEPGSMMSVEEARDYHAPQVADFAQAGAAMVTAITMNYPQEAAGIALAAHEAGIPAAISFTVETNGCLPSGQTLKEAIHEVDARSGPAPAYYMINCAHPTHFVDALSGDDAWRYRIRGVRANASRKSHAELNASHTLDEGDPMELAQGYQQLRALLPALSVVGGCCGTDHRHVDAICAACVAVPPAAV